MGSTLCGRLKSDYRYSPSLYNNFPFPEPTEEQKEKIEQTAQMILNARAFYPNSSLSGPQPLNNATRTCKSTYTKR